MVKEVEHQLAEPFRQSLRGLAGTVNIISTQVAGVRYGMVATAVMSLSMEPPSLAIAVNASASIHAPLLRRGAFAVNILAEWDQRLAGGFAKASGEARFAHGAWSSRACGADGSTQLPYLTNGQASIFCRIVDTHRSGSHTLFVAEVEDVVGGRERCPLIYCDGGYGAFAPGMPRDAVGRTA